MAGVSMVGVSWPARRQNLAWHLSHTNCRHVRWAARNSLSKSFYIALFVPLDACVVYACFLILGTPSLFECSNDCNSLNWERALAVEPSRDRFCSKQRRPFGAQSHPRDPRRGCRASNWRPPKTDFGAGIGACLGELTVRCPNCGRVAFPEKKMYDKLLGPGVGKLKITSASGSAQCIYIGRPKSASNSAGQRLVELRRIIRLCERAAQDSVGVVVAGTRG